MKVINRLAEDIRPGWLEPVGPYAMMPEFRSSGHKLRYLATKLSIADKKELIHDYIRLLHWSKYKTDLPANFEWERLSQHDLIGWPSSVSFADIQNLPKPQLKKQLNDAIAGLPDMYFSSPQIPGRLIPAPEIPRHQIAEFHAEIPAEAPTSGPGSRANGRQGRKTIDELRTNIDQRKIT